MSTSGAPAATSESAKPLLDRLRRLFSDASGEDLTAADPAAHFMALGLDSLTLTLAAAQVKREFGVVPTFRQLMETYRDFQALADFIANARQPAAASAAPQSATLAAAAPRAVLDASRPPRPGARLGRDPNGKPAWYVPDSQQPNRYVLLA